MSLDQLIKKLKPTFLGAASKNNFKPCRLFLSASDMKSRAITRHASADNPADAWTAAVDILKSSLGSVNPTILRADWVVEQQSMTWTKFLSSVAQVRRNYYRQGLALDPEYKMAFIEPEINGNAMLYRDSPIDEPNGVFNEDSSNTYCRTRFNCAFPTPDSSSNVIAFTTKGAFASDIEPNAILLDGEGLASDHRPVSHLDSAAILKLARNGAAYFAKEIKNKDQFLYDRYPRFDKTVKMRVPLKHFNFIGAMLDVYATYGRLGNSSLGAAITKALQYGIKNYLKYRIMPDGSEVVYIVASDDKDIRLGAGGAALLALAKHAVIMKTKKHTQLMEAIARGILSMQNADGSFAHAIDLNDYSVQPKVNVASFDGLATLGLLRLHALNGDQKLLDAAERAFNYFVANKTWQLHDPLMEHAVDAITRHLPKREYFDFGIKNFSDQLHSIWHRKFHYPRSLELLIAADNLLERMKTMPELSDLISKVNADDLHATLELQMKALIDAYFYPEFVMFFRHPEEVVDAFFLRHQAFRLLLLDMEFLLTGAIAYLQYLTRRDHEPVPSEALKGDEVVEIEPLIPPVPADFNPDPDMFARELKEHNGVIFFMLINITPITPGLELSVFRRSRLFRDKLGVDVTLITINYQNDLRQSWEACGLDCSVLNFYDYYQEIDRKAETSIVKPRFVNGIEGDLKFQDSYNELGFLGWRMLSNPANNQAQESFYYRRDGSVAIHSVYDHSKGKTEVKLMELIDRDGTVKHSFNSRNAAITHWLIELVSDKSKQFYIVNDEPLDYYNAFIKMTELKFDHVHVLQQLHNIHVLEPRDPFTSKPGYQYLYNKKVKTDVIVVLTKRQREDIIKRFKLNNIFQLPHSLTAVPKVTVVEYNPFKIIQVGRLHEQKGHDKAIEVMKRVIKYVPQATLHFYGKGSLQESIQKLIDEAGLNDHIKIEGFVDNMPAVYASAALSILPSRYEGSPLVVQESMQYGCPVVAFNCTYGPDDVIEEGKSGYIVPAGDVEAMADRIVRILTDDELRENFSKHCARSLEKFAPDVVARQWTWLFHNLINA